MRLHRPISTSLVIIVTLLAMSGATHASAAQRNPDAPGDAAQQRQSDAEGTVTLLTGDTVTLAAPVRGGEPTVTVRPAEGTAGGSSFSIRRRDGDVLVIPDDVASLVPRVLDTGLFNVTRLVEMGYTDAERSSIPLIVRGSDPTAGMSTLRRERALPSIDADVVELRKSAAGGFGSALAKRADPDTARTSAAGLDKVWLDAKLRASELDRNLSAIGADRAWQAGLSGRGVDVAVLDSGVDADHPDLAGQLVAQRDFTGSDTGDVQGHGTHVASVVAGSGAAAGGDRKGVAFGADLLSGKVLGDEGSGRTSWIIAGMRWATEQGAEVVNMSLGGPAGSSDGPLVAALNNLTRSTGTLFVVAAGNSGPSTSTIQSPGTAARALTVGAAGSNGGAAYFSSRGPAPGSYRAKPDLTAPGVDITGARAGGSREDPYVPMSGTSQATPHVAGAAALLLEQHPEWDWRRVKTVLTTTADPFAKPDAFVEGGGLLDLPHASATTLRLDRPNVDFGYLRYPDGTRPRDMPLQVTNTGTDTQRVTLDDRQRNLDKEQAPEAMVTLSRTELTLSPGESATVTVSLTPSNGGPGMYSGGITLRRSGHEPRVVPLSYYVEPPRHDVRLTVLDRDGMPYSGGTVRLVNVREMYPETGGGYMTARLDENGQATVRVAPGPYSMLAKIETPARGGGRETVALAGSPEVMVDGDRSFTIDARDARRLRPAEVAGTDTRVRQASIHYGRWSEDGGALGNAIYATPEQVRRGQVFLQPTQPVSHGRVAFQTRWRLAEEQRRRGGVERIYELLLGGGSVPDPPVYRVPASDVHKLARSRQRYNAPGDGTEYAESRRVFTDLVPSTLVTRHPLPVPRQRVELLTAAPNVHWQQCVVAPAQPVATLCGQRRSYGAGERVRPTWFETVTPAVRDPWHTRTSMRFPIGLSDGEHKGQIYDDAALGEQTLRLFRDGAELSRRGDSSYFEVPRSTPATFRLEHTARPPAGNIVAGRAARTTWTFPSHGPTEQGAFKTEPKLLGVDYEPLTDDRGALSRWTPMMTTVRLTLQGDSDGPRVVDDADLRFWVSRDGGRNWTEAIVVRKPDGSFFTIVPGFHPARGESVSVRAEATTGDRSVSQRIIDAYPVR